MRKEEKRREENPRTNKSIDGAIYLPLFSCILSPGNDEKMR
tara:strand:- start:1592 stop:1714 length:123 start_codon:yes stop_codon:yes gene_type:complete